eukprot:2755756-Alexandrium_andersonii.AAC.1
MPRVLMEPTVMWLEKFKPDGSLLGAVQIILVDHKNATSREWLEEVTSVPVGCQGGNWLGMGQGR